MLEYCNLVKYFYNFLRIFLFIEFCSWGILDIKENGKKLNIF